MGKRGPKPRSKVKIEWSSNFAYAVGLIATDGCLYRYRPCINLTSKDLEQIINFQRALGIKIHIGRKSRSNEEEKKYYVVQLQDKSFYEFLIESGIMVAKSKTLSSIKIPNEYFFDFLRGSFDGDGHSHSYWDKRWRSSFLLYLGFSSASLDHLNWIQEKLKELVEVKGHISKPGNRNCFQLRYAKNEAIKIIEKMYRDKKCLCLSRKKLKIEKSLAIMAELRGKFLPNLDKNARVL